MNIDTATTPTAVAVRELDELEGTLLPVATQVVESCLPCNLDDDDEPLEEAFVVPDNANQHNLEGVSDDSKTTVNMAGYAGKVRSQKEQDAIRNNMRKIQTLNDRDRNDIQSANARAKVRDREGLQIKDDRIRTDFQNDQPRKTLQEVPGNEPPSNDPAELGYQISEYNCGTYQTSDYEVTEYKSVYD